MPAKRSRILKSILFGLLTAVIITLVLTLALAAALVFLHFSDNLLRWCNLIIKLVSIAAGVCIAVPRNGRRGLVTGLVIALAYASAGYALYVLLGGAAYKTETMLGELLLGAAAGAVTGAVRANMHPRRSGIKTTHR